jgi:hypothetical protein
LDGGLCLVMLTTADGKSVQYGCIPEQQFPANGVSLAADNGASAHWNADGTIESTG